MKFITLEVYGELKIVNDDEESDDVDWKALGIDKVKEDPTMWDFMKMEFSAEFLKLDFCWMYENKSAPKEQTVMVLSSGTLIVNKPKHELRELLESI